MTLTSSSKAAECLLEQGHILAAKRLITSVSRDYMLFAQGKEGLEAALQTWDELFRTLRTIEKKRLIEQIPSAREMANHRKVVNLLIFAADAIASAAERHLESDYHLDRGEEEGLRERLRLLRQHASLLSFEFTSWHTASKSKKVKTSQTRSPRVKA